MMENKDQESKSTESDMTKNGKPNLESLVSRMMSSLSSRYVVIGKTKVKAWHAWLILGLVIGITTGVLIVANRSGQFEPGKAASTLTLEQAQVAAIAAHATADLKAKAARDATTALDIASAALTKAKDTAQSAYVTANAKSDTVKVAKAAQDSALAALKQAQLDLQKLLQSKTATLSQKKAAQNKVTQLQAAYAKAVLATNAAVQAAQVAAQAAAQADIAVKKAQDALNQATATATAAQKGADDASTAAAAADMLVQQLQQQAQQTHTDLPPQSPNPQSNIPGCGDSSSCSVTFSTAGVATVKATITHTDSFGNKTTEVSTKAVVIGVSGGGGGGGGNCNAGGTIVPNGQRSSFREQGVTNDHYYCSYGGFFYCGTDPAPRFGARIATQGQYFNPVQGGDLYCDNNGSSNWSSGIQDDPLLGTVDSFSLEGDGNYHLKGWACALHVPHSVKIQSYVNGPRGSGTLWQEFTADQEATDVARACQQPMFYLYRFDLSKNPADLAAIAGKQLYVYGRYENPSFSPTPDRQLDHSPVAVPGNPSPIVINSCSGSPLSINPGGTVTWTANVSGGSGSYSSSWSDTTPFSGNGSCSGNTCTWPRTYNNPGSVGASVCVTSPGASPVCSGQPGQATCGSITVNPPQQGAIHLRVTLDDIEVPSNNIVITYAVNGVPGPGNIPVGNGDAPGLPTGSYGLAYQSGGPTGVTGFIKLTATALPSKETCTAGVGVLCTLTLASGGDITYTFHFKSIGTIRFGVRLNNQPVSASISVDGDLPAFPGPHPQYQNVPLTMPIDFHDVPPLTLILTYRSFTPGVIPSNATFGGIIKADGLPCADGGNIFQCTQTLSTDGAMSDISYIYTFSSSQQSASNPTPTPTQAEWRGLGVP